MFMTALMRALAALAIAAIAAANNASAQDYPSKTVRMIVPFGAGGPADVYARVLAQNLQEMLKQNFVVENRPGAGALIGTEFVAKSPPDGYTLLVMSNTHTTNESLIPNRPYNLMRDFVPVSPINESDVMMVVNPGLGVKNLKEFIALAKSKPGQLNYASSGPGTPYHMAAELFKTMSGTDIVHVPHKTSGDMRTSVLGGHVQMMFDAITVLAPNVKEGKVVALGTSGKKRSTVMPEVPTIDEAGVPGYESTIWLGVMAPAKTPKPIVDTLNAAIRKIMERPDIRDTWGRQGATPMTMTPSEFDKYLRADIDKWAKVVDKAGLVQKK
jgi:tripartite-type tricarboxylate transporter receptor subunit TctC